MKPPMALSAVSIAADGSQRTWWSGDKYAANRPQSLSFRTRIGEGFSDAGVTLARRIDQDYNDLELYNDLVLVGDDGQIAYEGRIGSTPRSTSGGHSISVQCAGWMAHAKDRKFREVYVDRDLRGWQSISLPLQSTFLTVNSSNIVGGPEVATDTAGGASLKLTLDGQWAANSFPRAWAQYDAGPDVQIADVWYDTTFVGGPTSSSFYLAFYGADDDALTNQVSSADLHNLGVGQSGYYALSSARRWISADWLYSNAASNAQPSVKFVVALQNLALYGDHGLTLRGSDPGGLYASDVITDIAQRFCPKLNTNGVEDTALVIPQVAFKDRTTPFDAFLLLNGPHGYELAVWENKTLTFRPYDLSDYDWQVRMDQPGVDLSAQGDTTDELANYVVVEFDNVATGQRDQVSPSDDSSLEDTTVDHPANTHGLDVELTVGLTFPTTQEVAIAFGQSYLAEFNRPKNRGQITVQGHILDRAGHWIQPWMVRAGQTISVVDHPNDTPRLITETSYDHASRTVTISTDNGELNQLDAVVDYIRTSLTAANLG